LQWKLDAYERLQDCNEEFELWGVRICMQ
jgi:hypothetical protein